MNKTFKIEFQGMEKPLINMDKLNSGMESLNKLLDQSGDKALDLSEDFEKAFKELSEGVQQGSKDIQALSQHVIKTAGNLQTARAKADDLQHALDKAKSSGTASASEISKISNSLMKAQGEVNKFTAEIRKSMSQIDQMSSKMNDAKNVASRIKITSPIDPSSFESLDTLLDKETEFRDKMITLVNIGGQVAEAFGPMGTVISAGLQLAAPVVADFIESMYDTEGAISKVGKAISEDLAKEMTELDDLFNTLKDVNASYLDKKNAIEQINSKYGEFIGNLTEEELLTGKIGKNHKISADNLKEYIKTKLIQQAVDEYYGKEITSNNQKQVKAAANLAQAQRDLAEAEKARFASQAYSQERRDAVKAYEDAQKRVKQFSEEVKRYEAFNADLRRQAGETAKAATSTLGIDQKTVDATETVLNNNQKTKDAKEQQGKVQSANNSKEKETLDLLKEQLEVIKLKAEYSKINQEASMEALNVKDYDEAERQLIKAKKDWDDYVKETKANAGTNKTLEDLAKEKELLDEILENMRQRNETLKYSQSQVSEYFILNRSDYFGRIDELDETMVESLRKDGIEIPLTFMSGIRATLFKDKSGKLLTDQINKLIEEAFTTQVDPYKFLRERGIISIYDVALEELDNTDKDYQKRKAKLEADQKAYKDQQAQGKVDIDQEDAHKQKEFDKQMKDIQKGRKEQAEAIRKAEQEAAKYNADIQAQLNDPSYLAEMAALTAKYEQDRRSMFDRDYKLIENQVERINELMAGTVEVDADKGIFKVSGDNIDKLVEAGKISVEEAEQLMMISSTINQNMNNMRNKFEQDQVDLKETYVGRSMEASRKKNKKFIKDLELDIEELKDIIANNEREMQDEIDKAMKKKAEPKALQSIKTKYANKQLQDMIKQRDKEVQLMIQQDLNALLNFRGTEFDIDQFAREIEIRQNKLVSEWNDKIKKMLKENNIDPSTFTPDINEDPEARIGRMLKAFNLFADPTMELFSSVIGLMDVIAERSMGKIREELSLVEQAISDTQSRLSELESDLEGKQSGRRDAVLAAIELEKQREKNLAEEKIRLMKKIEAEERKVARRRKALAISQSIIDGARAILSIWAAHAANPLLAGILTGISAATTATQIATISMQKFATGGYTGEGTTKDETGHKVAGVVHAGEWVAPKWMVDNPSFKGVISSLEASRQRGYAVGGPVSTDVLDGINASLNPNSDIIRQMKVYTDAAIKLSNRPVIADVKEFSNVQSSMMRRMSTNSIG